MPPLQEFDPFIANLDSSRWIILLSFSALNFSNQYVWISTGGILDQAQQYYRSSKSEILYFMNIYSIIFIFTSFPAVWLVNKYFKFSIILSSLLNMSGSWCMVLSQRNYWHALLSQVLNGLAQSFILQVCPFLASRFFHAKERFIAVSIAIYSGCLGSAIGYIIGPLVIGKHFWKINSTVMQQAMMCTLPFILLIVFMKDRPSLPPNASQEVSKTEMSSSIKMLFKRESYVISVLCFSCLLGDSWTIITVLNDVLDSKEYAPATVGLIGIIYSCSGIVAGILGSLFITYVPGSRNCFDNIIKLLATIILLSLSVFCLQIEHLSQSEIMLLMAFVGFGLVGMLPFACECLIEIGFPTDENTNMNIFYILSCAISVTLVQLTAMQQLFGYFRFYWILLVIVFPCYHLIGSHKTTFHRSETEKKRGSMCSSFNEPSIQQYLQFDSSNNSEGEDESKDSNSSISINNDGIVIISLEELQKYGIV